MTSRRRFITLLPLLGVAAEARAENPPLDPKDPQAVSLGYVPDAARVDKARFPKYAPPQACGNCAVYAGQPGAASGPCPVYQNKLVQAKGWCSTYVKKA